MRVLRFALPLSLFATACAARQTPAGSLDANAPDDSAPLRSYELPARAEVLRRWTLPADDPWSPYCKYTLITALGVDGAGVTAPAFDTLPSVPYAAEAGRRLGLVGLPPRTAWVVDLRGAASVAFGSALRASAGGRSVALVPTFNNWPAANEMVPAEETLAALAVMAPADDPARGPGLPVFLLDAWRLAHRYDETDDDTYDNRYALTSSDLPDAATLRARGIDRIVYVVYSLSQTTVEEDDLHPIFLQWEAAGIRIAMVDLADLVGMDQDDPWDTLLIRRDLWVEPRETILGGESFYLRARGGFGGVHARPSVVAIGHGGGAWWHGGGG